MTDVLIRNKRPQAVTVTVMDTESAVLKEVQILPFQSYGPLPENRVGLLTKALANRGHVRIVPA